MIIRTKSDRLFKDLTQKHRQAFPCGGGGLCGKCKVKVLTDPLPPASPEDQRVLDSQDLMEGYRLACHMPAGYEVEVFFQEGKRSLSKDQATILSKGKLASFLVDPVIQLKGSNIYYNGQLVGPVQGKGLNALVVDIGSTTLVVSLVDLERAKEITSLTALNPQRVFGEDVMSRISTIQKEPERLNEMQAMLIQVIKDLGIQLCQETGYEPTSIYGVFVAANAVMNHILLNTTPVPLGLAPYPLQYQGVQERLFSDMDLDDFGQGIVATLPNISAFVGGDILAGILATGLHRQEGTVLLVDIGTNGELVLNHQGQLFSTSCAAGPALEGMNIGCGMMAGPGAIEEAKFVHQRLRYKTINRAKAVGICGSGILALVREYLKVGLIQPSGRIATEDQVDSALHDYLDLKHKRLWVDKRRKLFLSQKDIRQIQLAKGAILSGIQALLQEAHLAEDQIDQVYIAGQFGSYVQAASLIGVGIIPQSLEDRIDYVGNTAKSGAHLFALNQSFYNHSSQLANGIRHIELSLLDHYDRLFAKAALFPQQRKESKK